MASIPGTVLGILAGAAVSIATGSAIGAYVVTGVDPAYAAAPPRVRPEPPLVDQDRWPAPDYLAPISGYGDDQANGVRASGSSRL